MDTDDLPHSEAAAVERLRVEIAEANRYMATDAPQALRDEARVRHDLLSIAVQLLEAPYASLA